MRHNHFGICSVAFAVLGLVSVSALAAVITVSGTGDTIAVEAEVARHRQDVAVEPETAADAVGIAGGGEG